MSVFERNLPVPKKALTRDRRSQFDVFTALAAVAVFAACSYPSAPGAETAGPAALFQDAGGLVRVTVPLPTGGGGGVRPGSRRFPNLHFTLHSKQEHPL
jgi:hypothetical protein